MTGFDDVSRELVRLEDDTEELRADFDEALLHGWDEETGRSGDAAIYAVAMHFYRLGRNSLKTNE